MNFLDFGMKFDAQSLWGEKALSYLLQQQFGVALEWCQQAVLQTGLAESARTFETYQHTAESCSVELSPSQPVMHKKSK